jgi:glycine C-acetyltransferase/8-amino-7-oxononanoate synthase
MNVAVSQRQDDELIAAILRAMDHAMATVAAGPLDNVLVAEPRSEVVLRRCATEISGAARDVSEMMRNWATHIPWETLEALDPDFQSTDSPSWRFLLQERLTTVRADIAAMVEPAGLERTVDPEDQHALDKNAYDFFRPAGPDLLGRTEDFHAWVRSRQSTGTWPYSRTLEDSPNTTSVISDELGRRTQGINFASQDYLSFNLHPAIREAALRALDEYGPHSAGSPMAVGNTIISRKLEEMLADLVGLPHITLFPTGWAAGFGAVTGLVRQSDHVIVDRFAHACLQQGARAATRNVRRFDHLSIESARGRLAEIRSRDTRHGILVVTDGLFSVDADWPDVAALQEVCHEYAATLLVDVAHDLGAMGPGGTGVLGMQGMLGKVDLVTGAFSKSFASNGGFLAADTPAVMQYVRMFGGSHMFSNALSPVQTAIVAEAIRLIRSAEGDRLRAELCTAVDVLRTELNQRGLTCLGSRSPIVPLLIGNEKLARTANRLLFDRGVLASMVEFPVVPAGSARFRLQVQARHTPEEARQAARIIEESITDSRAHLASAFGTAAA